jgi:hypothetical protein
MAGLFQSLLLLLGLLVGRAVQPDAPCAGACPDVAPSPTLAWTAEQTVPAAEARLWARAPRRPGQPGPLPEPVRRLAEGHLRVLVVLPAPERVRPAAVRATTARSALPRR